MAGSLMIVDGSHTMRKIIMRTIRVSGLEFDTIEEADSGTEALERLQVTPVDVVLCDLDMPEVDGIELIRRIREIPTCDGVRIVAISTGSSDDLVSNVLANGANNFMTKPFTPREFEEELAPLVS